MTVSEMLKRAQFDLPAISRLTGFSHSQLKQWSAGLRVPPPGAPAKIAAAFRTHGRQLLADADLLDPPPVPEPVASPKPSPTPPAPPPPDPASPSPARKGRGKDDGSPAVRPAPKPSAKRGGKKRVG